MGSRLALQSKREIANMVMFFASSQMRHWWRKKRFAQSYQLQVKMLHNPIKTEYNVQKQTEKNSRLTAAHCIFYSLYNV
jgi:hypothetical protein